MIEPDKSGQSDQIEQLRMSFVEQGTDAHSDTGFATDSDVVLGGSSFFGVTALLARSRSFGAGGRNSVRESEASYRISRSGNTITIEVEGEEFDLDWNQAFRGYTGTFDGVFYFVGRQLLTSAGTQDAVEVVQVFIQDGNNIDHGFVPVGFNTDPEVIFEREGRATYSGDATAVVRQGNNRSFGEGTASFNVNFNANTISGRINLNTTNAANATTTFPRIRLAIEDASIAGNSFRQDAQATRNSQDALDFDVEDAEILGEFYGADGQIIAGQASAEGERDGESFALQAGFLAEE